MIKNKLHVIILAAGKGTRMGTKLPKVLHKIANLPMINHVINTSLGLSPDSITIVASPQNIDEIKSSTQLPNHNNQPINFALQNKQLGTGDAVQCAVEINKKNNIIADDDIAIVLLGDAPMIGLPTLKKLLNSFMIESIDHVMTVVGIELDNPKQYGRLVIEKNHLSKIVEFKDATDFEKSITLCNSGVMAFKVKYLEKYIKELRPNNNANEYYLTDIVEIANSHNKSVKVIKADNSEELLGVNDLIELAECERMFQNKKRKEMMKAGVKIIAPETVFFSYDTVIGHGSTILPNVYFAENVKIGENVTIGPFAHIRPKTTIDNNTKIGNFVEIKKSHIREGAKINHFSYIGDSDIGKKVNIGAGTITCNYDGYYKHKTVIKDYAMVGSNNSIVAPVVIGKNTITGAGSVITKDVPDNSIAISRSEQSNLAGKAIAYHNKRKGK